MTAPTWSEIVAPIVMHFEVAAAFNGQAVFTASGASALGKIISRMALIIDEEIEVRTTQEAVNLCDQALGCERSSTTLR